ncbi:hypothetical protein NLJ89_g182 [Agrocybe chaxingu]|uniref:Uncharacterized protein n=1 Tax=Agrocybe chaxingu TaxID=84603 RepID=A0A9W8N2H9_9AGAR|nr:hypothetical protein NLJ89_g182 [Agrocybe chaxingu]
MNLPSSTPADLPTPSPMSELDAFSDSEWLDVTASRDSDDNDSLTDQDSDHDDLASMPRSRRSSFSSESAMNSDVDAWEGFVSDSGDEVAPDTYPVPPPAAPGAEPIAVGFNPTATEAVDPAVAEEDQRVKEALDQSFVGTLSASRSSTGGHLSSTHTSIRDLRLSFPDPLTKTTSSSTTEDEVEPPQTAAPIITPPPLEDPGLLSTTPEIQHHEVGHFESEDRKELEVVLYGAPSGIKWRFVQELVRKALVNSGYDFINNLRDDEQIQTLRLVRKSDDAAPFFDMITVHDRTFGVTPKAEVDNLDFADHPSLAIVYLPTTKLPSLPWHTAFLPVFVPSSFITDDEKNTALQSAEDDWDLLAVPADRILKLGTGKSIVFDSQGLQDVKPSNAHDVLSCIGHETKITTSKLLTEQVKSVNAVTLFALMSIIMGFACNTAFRPASPTPTPTVNSSSSSSGNASLWNIVAHADRSVVASSGAYTHGKGCSVGNSVISSPAFALSVVNAGTTSLSVTSPPSSSSLSLIVASSSKAMSAVTTTTPAKSYNCKGSTSDITTVPTDVILRAMTTLSEIPRVKPSSSTVASRANAASGSTVLLTEGSTSKSSIASAASAAANLNLNTVSEVFDATAKALTEAVSNDLNELVEAADELFSSIVQQTDIVIKQSKGKARALGEQLQNLNEEVIARNEKARKRAKELKKKGEDIMRGAKEEFKERSNRARGRARELKKTMMDGGTEAWKTYEKAQGEWEEKLLGKVGRKGKQSKKGRRNERRASDKENVATPGVSERKIWNPRGSRRSKV